MQRPMRSCTSSSHEARIARIDISALLSNDIVGSRDVANQLSNAFADTGFAIVTGTSVSMQQMGRLRALAYRFFKQNLEVKLRANSGQGKGYGQAPYCYMEENGAQLLGDFSRPSDIVESLTYRGLSTPEVQEKLPQRPPELKEAMIHFNNSMVHMRRALEKVCEIALGLEERFLTSRCIDGAESLRLAYYPDELNPLEGQMRYGAHVDSYGITILNLDPANPGGLQVKIDDTWIDVPFVPGSFVLNAGALLSRWTNGEWKASVHRVLCKPGERLSIVSNAIRPSDDVMIEVLEPCCRHGKAHFPPVLARDFYAERVAMHRPTYLRERSASERGMRQISQEIRSYRI